MQLNTMQVIHGVLFLLISQLAYTQNCVGGMADGLPCSSVHLRSHLDGATVGLGEGNDIWGWTSPNSGREYALVGGQSGTAFVDVSDASNAWLIGRLATPSFNSDWRDLKVIDNYVYIGSEAGSSGIQVFDLTLLDAVTSPPAMPIIFEEEDNNNSDFISKSHNIVTNPETGLLLAVGTNRCSGGLVMYDTKTNPADPPQQSCFSTDGYTHDAVCFVYRGPDTDYIGQEICVALNEDTYTIVNVTDRNNPTMISRTGYDAHQYTHQGWVTDDHRYLIVNDELDETRNGINTRTLVFDISNLDAPIDHHTFTSTERAIDHNLYVRGSYVYQANYKAGLRILDISDIDNKNITETAYFDVMTGANNAQFDGAWSIYPYFDNNKIIINTIGQGLFVVEHDADYFFVRKTDTGVINVISGQSGTYDLEIVTVGGFAGQVNINLSGLPTGATSNINSVNSTAKSVTTTSITVNISGSTPAGNYSLMVEATAPNAPTQRLALGLIVEQNANALATNLLTFQAQATKTIANQLQWEATNETSQTTYAIQRSTTGETDWETIGQLAAQPNTPQIQYYEWLDRKPFLQTYYRLLTTEADGNQTISPTVLVQRETTEQQWLVYPNPVIDQLQMSYIAKQEEVAQLQIINPIGAIVHQQQLQLTTGANYPTINVSHLSSGVYFIYKNGILLDKFVKSK